MDSLKRLAVVFAVIAAAAWMMVAYSVAQTTAPLPPETPSHQTIPEASGSSTDPLGDKLDRSGGVIKPPAGIDPGLSRPPPQHGRSRVIAPPGTGSNRPDIEPK